ncbi:hypothetical protein BC936DRAFT_138269 [Jimgerdemannia flammicorona]|uniref:Uncharacterized protein n=1 Tax=Jimgerdemannia flammicorona TaxID=994334 RepID=A0A433CVA0_9FUNG|nr:hypothetical protein BC936DRAFT_138269 [Jimgerdemannia flammicorona]
MVETTPPNPTRSSSVRSSSVRSSSRVRSSSKVNGRDNSNRLIVLFHSADNMQDALVKNALAGEFPNSSIGLGAPKNGGKRIAFIDFSSGEAYNKAARRVNKKITVCGFTGTIKHSRPPQPQQHDMLPVSQAPPTPIPGSSLKTTSTLTDDDGVVYIWYFWDIENLQIPKHIAANGAYVHDLVTAIRKSCENLYPKFKHMDFCAMSAQPNVVSAKAGESLHASGVILQQYPGKYVKMEQADKIIVTSMNTKEHQTNGKYGQRVFVLLTSDGGYQNDLSLLKAKGIKIILIHDVQIFRGTVGFPYALLKTSEIFKRCADHCIPSATIFKSIITSNDTSNAHPSSKPSIANLDIHEDPDRRSRSKSPAPAPRPSRSTRQRSRGRSVTAHQRTQSNGGAGGSREASQLTTTNAKDVPTTSKDCLRINLPQTLGLVTQDSLRASFGTDVNISIRSGQTPHRHAIITFHTPNKATRFAGIDILVNGEFVKVNLLNQSTANQSTANQSTANQSTVPPEPPKPPKDITIAVKVTPSKYHYITNYRGEFDKICKDVTVNLDFNHTTVRLKGHPTAVNKTNSDLRSWLENLRESVILDHAFNWIGAKLFQCYHLNRISVQWSISICLYRQGDALPVIDMTNFKTDTVDMYHVVLVGPNKRGTDEGIKEVHNLKLEKPVDVEFMDKDVFKSAKEQKKLLSISKEHHCYIDVHTTGATIYAFTEGEQEMARAAIEMALTKQVLIQVEPIKNQYLQRYRIAELDAIRRQHHSVNIFFNDVTTAIASEASSTTSLKRDSITLKGPPKDIPKARDAVEALLDSVDVQHVDVVYPVTQEGLALHRFKSLAGLIKAHENVVVEYSGSVATNDSVIIHVVASGETGVVQNTLEKFAAVRFGSKTTLRF